jgi:hypothetical protein
MLWQQQVESGRYREFICMPGRGSYLGTRLGSMADLRSDGSMGFFHKAMLLIAFCAPLALVSSPVAAAARHYDCSKPGNANKAACKSGSATTAAPAAKPTKTTTTKTTKTTTTRQYDCTKAGNANKAQCRAAAKQSPTGKTGAVSKTTKTTATKTDCTKWYNKMRATCRTTSSSSAPKTTIAPASKPTALKRRTTNAPTGGSGETVNNNANGAIAQCKDGSFSHAAHRAGACSRHGGVTKWLAG